MIRVTLPDVTVTATCRGCGKEENYKTEMRLSGYYKYSLPPGWKELIVDHSQDGYPYYGDFCPECAAN